MPTGAITGYIDVAQLTLYAFWIFFVGLVLYIRREDRREGYPLLTDIPQTPLAALAGVPAPKVFRLPHGGIRTAPHDEGDMPLKAVDAAPWFGAPIVPTGNPMIDGIGPAAYAQRKDVPELTYEGETRQAPLRIATAYWVETTNPDPRGMDVIAADGQVAGVVREIWVDRTEPAIRYFEVEVAATGQPVLLPLAFVNSIEGGRRNRITLSAITAAQFADVPKLKNPDQVTALEEDMIAAYYGGGYMFATPGRSESLL